MKISLLLLCTLAQVIAFAPNGLAPKVRANVAFRPVETPRFLSRSEEDSSNKESCVSPNSKLASPHASASVAAATAGFASALLAMVPAAMAAAAFEPEMAELPPPYVPVLFSIGLLVGVGLLTGTLGDVINEEALLGMQSGARAKKEIERSRSSYFKKK
jgi:hypothetical protein